MFGMIKRTNLGFIAKMSIVQVLHFFDDAFSLHFFLLRGSNYFAVLIGTALLNAIPAISAGKINNSESGLVPQTRVIAPSPGSVTMVYQ